MQNSVKFSYHILNNGVAEGSLYLKDTSVAFQLSNFANPLRDLLHAMMQLLTEPSHLWEEENQQWIEWYLEKGMWRWLLSTHDGKHLWIKIMNAGDFDTEHSSHCLMDAQCSLDHFYLAIVSELDALIKQIGLLNYHRMWKGEEFPLTVFLYLKKYLIDKKLWQYNTSEVEGHNLNREMDILLT